jgi:hypothetical protein
MPRVNLSRLVLAMSVSIATVSLAGAQPSAASQGLWAGWARCEIRVSGQGYSDHQTHTWTLGGGTPTVSGAFRVYPATWSVVGGGSVQHSQGTQSLMAQWATTAQNLSAPLAVFVRASNGKMFIQARHAQVRAPGAVNGYQQLTIDGKPQMPGKIGAEAFEWAFPVVEVSRPRPGENPTANGSSTPVVNGKVGYMQPAATQASASCTWQFSQGATPAPPPSVTAQEVPTPGGSGGATAPPPGQTSGDTGTCVSAPQSLVATATTAGLVTMKWGAPASGVATSYIIEASSQAGGAANLANFNTGNSKLSLDVPNVPNGTYYVRVRALAGCGTSATSNEVALVVQGGVGGACPSAPRNLAASLSAQTLTLNWAEPASGVPTSYVVQAGDQPGRANLANFDTNSTALSLVSATTPAGSYYTRVYGKSASCASPTFLGPASNEVLVVVQ